jgi:FAD/FMN-containing dehydrogenase
MQKEGTDGVITSAMFVLYPEYKAKQTLCLEFFGPDFDEASRVILELSRAFPFPPTIRKRCLRSSISTTNTSAPSATR